MKACSRPDFWVPGCSVRRPHHPLGLRRHSSQLAQGESPDAGAARAGPGLHLRTQVWGARSVAAAESGSGLGWRVSALRLLSENITVGGERPRASLLSVPGAGSPRSRQVRCLARAAFWLWRAVSLHCPRMQGLVVVVVVGVSFMKVLILLTWMLPALASLFLG